MKKLITICDYCGKIIDGPSRFIQSGTELDESSFTQDETDYRMDLCEDCFEAISSVISTKMLERRKDKEEPAPDPEEDAASKQQEPEEEPQDQEPAEEGAASKQQEPEEEPQDQEPAEEGAALKQQEPEEELQQAPKQEPEKKPVREVDHGRIVALYTAKPPRSIAWIAEDCKCSQQTVVNHLVKAGLYKTKKMRIEEKEKENQENE